MSVYKMIQIGSSFTSRLEECLDLEKERNVLKQELQELQMQKRKLQDKLVCIRNMLKNVALQSLEDAEAETEETDDKNHPESSPKNPSGIEIYASHEVIAVTGSVKNNFIAVFGLTKERAVLHSKYQLDTKCFVNKSETKIVSEMTPMSVNSVILNQKQLLVILGQNREESTLKCIIYDPVDEMEHPVIFCGIQEDSITTPIFAGLTGAHSVKGNHQDRVYLIYWGTRIWALPSSLDIGSLKEVPLNMLKIEITSEMTPEITAALTFTAVTFNPSFPVALFITLGHADKYAAMGTLELVDPQSHKMTLIIRKSPFNNLKAHGRVKVGGQTHHLSLEINQMTLESEYSPKTTLTTAQGQETFEDMVLAKDIVAVIISSTLPNTLRVFRVNSCSDCEVLYNLIGFQYVTNTYTVCLLHRDYEENNNAVVAVSVNDRNEIGVCECPTLFPPNVH